MTLNHKLRVMLTEREDEAYCLTWPDPTNVQAPLTVRIVTLQNVQSDFPEFCKAITECHSHLNPGVPLEQIIICGAYTYAEMNTKRKRFQMYTHLAYVADFFDITKLPN